jgi:hypothetical protein
MKLSNGEADSSVHLGVYAEDEAHTSGDTGIGALVVRGDTPAALSGTDGDYEMLQVSGGFLWTRNRVVGARIQTDVTRPADTTAYAVNDCISDSTSAPTSGGFTFAAAARVSGGAGIIRGYQVCTSNDPATTLIGEIFVFTTSATNVNDNAAFVISDTEVKTLVAKLPFNLEDIGNNGFYAASGLGIRYTCSGSDDLRFMIRAKNAYTPASAEVLTFTLEVDYLD